MDRSQLLKMSSEQLDELFKQSPPGNIPNGEGAGTAVVCPGTWWARVFAWLTRWFWWQGKIFNAEGGSLRNRITPFGLSAIKAKVYKAPSWLDEQEAIVLDYSKTSLVARKIRDEIREVAPGLYLGKVWWGRKRLIDFIVSFQYEPAGKFWRRVIAVACLLALALTIYFVVRLTSDRAVAYADNLEHFKYGSTGGERGSGIPYSVFKVLPRVFPEYLPGQGYASLGFIYEKDKDGNPRDLPVGFSRRKVQGVDRVFVNCAICHVGSVRDSATSEPTIIVGMPSNTVDLEGFTRFLINCVKDEQFNAQRLVPEIKRDGTEDWINRQALSLVGISLMRDRLLMIGDRFKFLDREPDAGPGRFDTFNPPKVLLNFRMDNLPRKEQIGLCDFPSIWYQGARRDAGMHLHWDGNNNSVEERNRSAAFGTGATPATLDRDNIKKIEDWLLTAEPMKYPYTIDEALAAKGGQLYAQYCASCHGKSGTDFSGEYVGQVTPIERIKTDRWRLDSYTFDLCANQNLFYAGYGDERFSHFRKTFGYANAPLDGIWLRAPYLHNGSVPTLRDLLEPEAMRPKVFYRGYDVYDPKRVGFVGSVAEENGRKFFLYDTSLEGNGNQGHDGPEYGTLLSPEEKDAIVEFLKKF
ncbi:MAG TPA: cytochrome c [Blastocatellia bacterium]|jgi:hypothetical protein